MVAAEQAATPLPRPPHKLGQRRRRWLLLALAVLVAAGLIWKSSREPAHRPQTLVAEQGSLLYYQDGDHTYTVGIHSSNYSDLPTILAQGQTQARIPSNSNWGFPIWLSVVRDDSVVCNDEFMALVADISCVVEAVGDSPVFTQLIAPRDPANGGLSYTLAGWALSALPPGGENVVTVTLDMNNGDSLVLTWPISLSILPQVTLSWRDADFDLDTADKLNAFLSQLDALYGADTVVTLELPPLTYVGDIVIQEHSAQLIGYSGDDGQTVINGSLTIKASYPGMSDARDLHFVSPGGGTALQVLTGLIPTQCSFSGYDVALDVADGGWSTPNSCVFTDNGVGWYFHSSSSTHALRLVENCVFSGNQTAVWLQELPGQAPLEFINCDFNDNVRDLDDPHGLAVIAQ